MYSSARSDLSLAGLDCRQVACSATRKKCHSCRAAPSTVALHACQVQLNQLGRQVCIVAQQFVQQTSLENCVRPVRRSATTLADQRVGNRPVCPTNTFIYIWRCVCGFCRLLVWPKTVAHYHSKRQHTERSAAEKPTRCLFEPQSYVGFCVHNKENGFLNSEQSPYMTTYTYHIKLSHNFT